jgi:hypothetical protein
VPAAVADGRAHDVASDLVEYLLLMVPDAASLAAVAPALVELAEGGTVRLLDLVVIRKEVDGALEFLELEDVEALAGLRPVADGIGGLLTERDIELISLALEPATIGLVLLTEDRWALPLAAAARGVGGRIIAGERIPASRIDAVVVSGTPDVSPGG